MQSAFRPGDQLREIRNRLGVTTREVEELSRKIALESENEEFCISNAWLTQLENKNSVPSIYKLFSLSVIYRIKFTQLLTLFGISLADTIRYQLSTPLQNTHLAAMESPDADKPVTFPVRFDRGFTLEKTNLISRMVEMWGGGAAVFAADAGRTPLPVRLHWHRRLLHVPVAAPGLSGAD